MQSMTVETVGERNDDEKRCWWIALQRCFACARDMDHQEMHGFDNVDEVKPGVELRHYHQYESELYK